MSPRGISLVKSSNHIPESVLPLGTLPCKKKCLKGVLYYFCLRRRTPHFCNILSQTDQMKRESLFPCMSGHNVERTYLRERKKRKKNENDLFIFQRNNWILNKPTSFNLYLPRYQTNTSCGKNTTLLPLMTRSTIFCIAAFVRRGFFFSWKHVFIVFLFIDLLGLVVVLRARRLGSSPLVLLLVLQVYRRTLRVSVLIWTFRSFGRDKLAILF